MIKKYNIPQNINGYMLGCMNTGVKPGEQWWPTDNTLVYVLTNEFQANTVLQEMQYAIRPYVTIYRVHADNIMLQKPSYAIGRFDNKVELEVLRRVGGHVLWTNQPTKIIVDEINSIKIPSYLLYKQDLSSYQISRLFGNQNIKEK